MHGELAFWTGLQIDDMTEQFYFVKINQPLLQYMNVPFGHNEEIVS